MWVPISGREVALRETTRPDRDRPLFPKMPFFGPSRFRGSRKVGKHLAARQGIIPSTPPAAWPEADAASAAVRTQGGSRLHRRHIKRLRPSAPAEQEQPSQMAKTLSPSPPPEPSHPPGRGTALPSIE